MRIALQATPNVAHVEMVDQMWHTRIKSFGPLYTGFYRVEDAKTVYSVYTFPHIDVAFAPFPVSVV